MENLEIYCVTHLRLPFLETLGYKIAAAGNTKLPENYISCSEGDNIIAKEKHYSEYVFHYWFWKNKLKSYNDDTWIGFCQRRRFWLQKEVNIKPTNSEDLNRIILKTIPAEWKNFNSVIQPPIDLKEKKMVMIKRGYKSLIKDPSIFFNKKKQTIKLHFDMHHGYGNLDKAIDVMNIKDREEFREYVNTKTEFSSNNMFISKKNVMDKWFKDVFEWLFNCEKIFGFENLTGYETTRIYAYLAERYLSFWFKKYSHSIEWPWTFVDLK
tara:strand:- start:104 stop:904 length:801 start_codon:yes stop_codon:yes gene_type:complete